MLLLNSFKPKPASPTSTCIQNTCAHCRVPKVVLRLLMEKGRFYQTIFTEFYQQLYTHERLKNI